MVGIDGDGNEPWKWKMRAVLGNVWLLRHKTSCHHGLLYSGPSKPFPEVLKQREENITFLNVSCFSLRREDQYRTTICLDDWISHILTAHQHSSSYLDMFNGTNFLIDVLENIIVIKS